MRRLWLGFVAMTLLLSWSALRPAPEVRDIPMRDPLPDGPLRIAVFGTSLSAPPQTWPDTLADVLTSCRGYPIAAQRIVGPGKGSAWALGQIARVAETSPDLVLIEFAINDADFRDGVSLETARAQHLRLIEGLHRALPQVPVVLMTMSPAYGPSGWIRPRLAAYYSQYSELAQEERIGLIDIYPRWLSLPHRDRGLAEDGLHPDAAVAEKVIVEALAGYLDPDRRCP